MNYDFPEIKHINDVLPHIQGHNEFLVMEKEYYTVINYAVAFEETFQWDDADRLGSAIRRECRGLIFDKNTGNLISHPYHKFFNVGEKLETQLNKINLYEPHVVLEKLDGSMIRPIPTEQGFRLATKSGISSHSMSAEVFIADKQNYYNLIRDCIKNNLTPIFEWVTPNPKQRIVVYYQQDNLILTGIRILDNGKYIQYKQMKEIADAYNIPCVEVIDGLAKQNIELLAKQVGEWEGTEGIVIRFDDGHMVKIKADDYVLRHKVKSNFTQEKNILQIILDDRVDDIIPLLYEEDAKLLKDFHHKFWIEISRLENKMNALFETGNSQFPDRKDFAVNFVQKLSIKSYEPILYGMKGGLTARELILSMVQKSLTSQTKIDANRWLFGNLNWNTFNF
jgi:RNA ligase